ncbi:MAG: hypothetical protein J0I06_02600 [Planctomycetes bacterium]|nr:hypothetical protein [Planctomycetota bacterium]
MNVSNEQLVSEEAIARTLRATRANDAATAPRRHPRQTDQCPNIARFASVLRRHANRGQQDAWTPDEARHVRGCAFCQSLFPLFVATANEVDAAVAHEDTVTSLDTSQETQVGLPAPEGKKKGGPPKPSGPREAGLTRTGGRRRDRRPRNRPARPG